MTTNMEESPAPVSIAPGNAPAHVRRARLPLFCKFVFVFGLFIGSALLASVLLDLWLSDQTLAPLHALLIRAAALMLLGLSMALAAGLLLARSMAVPITALQDGAVRLGWGELGHRIDVRTGDELETLAHRFNEMAGRLQESYATLEDKVEERTGELSEALQQQTATADVLKVISRSAFDLQAVLDTLVVSAVRHCNAYDALILLRDGEWLRVKAHHGPIPIDFADWPLTRNWTSGRAVVDGKPVHVPDIAAAGDEFPDSHAHSLRQGHRSILSVPLLRGEEAIGAIAIRRNELRPFSDKHIELVTTFADQAVIAIENVRLFTELEARNRELNEALEQQTATSEILRVISTTPTDAQPVFETIVRNAVSLCGSLFANVFQYDGELLHFVATDNVEPGYVELLQAKYPMRPDPSQVSGRVVLSRSVVRLEDALGDPDYDHRFPVAMSWRRMLGVPMLREGELLGVIVVGWAEPGPVSKRQEELLRTFADQAVIAIENVRLFDEVQARTRELAQSVEELRALGEVSQAVNSTLDLETVLNTIVAKAVQLSGTDAGAIYVLNKANTKFKLRATYGLDEAMVAAIRDRRIRPGETAIGRATERRQPVQIPDVRYEPSSSVLDIVVQAGFRAILIVPLLGPERAIGVLVIRRKAPGEFPQSTVELLQTFAAQSVLAIQNARLFHEIEEKSRELELASRHKSQFLANMSHELRTPLNAILGYSELILDDIYGAVPDKARAALERVQSNGKHLLGLINDVLDLAKIEAGRLTLSLTDYSMNEVVASVVAAVEALAAEKCLALKVEMPPDLPKGHGDEQRIRQVLLNLVSNAIKFTDSGEVAIRVRTGDGAFQVAVSDTGPGISAEDQAKLFQEFQQADNSSTRNKGGTGLGLAISRRFIDLHGGRIWVESAPGQGSTFTFELPVTVDLQEDVE
jgi:signal transduction histidine kinase